MGGEWKGIPEKEKTMGRMMVRGVSSKPIGGQLGDCLDWHHFGNRENSVNSVSCSQIIKTMRVKQLILHLVFWAIGVCITYLSQEALL